MATEHADLLASLALGQPVTQHVKAITGKERIVLLRGRINEETAQIAVQEQSFPESLGNIPSVVPKVAANPFNLRKKRKILREEDLPPNDPKIMPTKEKLGKLEMRRPVRPIDRQKMRPWLKNLLDTGSVFGLNWMKREDGIFQISWRHASRLGWNLETDGDVFERWARHTGIFKDGDDPEPKRWKANFRCALHSLPDVKELTSPTDRKGRNASRTYRFLNPSEVQPPVKRKHRYTIQIPYSYERSSDDNTSQNAESDNLNSEEEVGETVHQIPHCDHDYAARQDEGIPEETQTTSAAFQRHGSGFVLIKSKDAHEYEFRLTSSSAESTSVTQQTDLKKQFGSLKSLSAQRKTQATKKKSSVVKTITGVSRKAKGNAKVAKSRSLQNARTKARKTIEENTEGQSKSKPSKISLKELLSSRQGTTSSISTKKSRPKRSPNSPAKKNKKEKEDSETLRKSKLDEEKNMETPVQHHGLQACMLLLEAATQLDRMDSLTTTASSVSSLTTAASATITANKLPGTSVNSVQLTEAPFKALHHFLGLSAVTPSLTCTPAMASLMSAASHASSAATAITFSPASSVLDPCAPSKSVNAQINKQDSVYNNKAQDNDGYNHDSSDNLSSTASTTPGAGLSMLKQLLRLTCPISTTNVTASVPSVMTSFPQNSSSQTMYSSNLIGSCPVEKKIDGHTVLNVLETSGKPALSTDRSHYPNFEVVAEYEVGSSPAETWEETDEKNFPYLRVHTSKVYVKQDSHTSSTPELNKQSSPSDAASAAVSSVKVSVSSSPIEQLTSSMEVCSQKSHKDTAAAPHVSASDSSVPTVSLTSLSSAAHINLPVSLGCSLPQAFSVMLPKAANHATPSVTRNSMQLPAVKKAPSLTSLSSSSLDLSQLLSLCAANGNSQIIFKPEEAVVSVVDDDIAINNTYSLPKSDVNSQGLAVPTSTVQHLILTGCEAVDGIKQELVPSQEENQVLTFSTCELVDTAYNSKSHTKLSEETHLETFEQNLRNIDTVPSGQSSFLVNVVEEVVSDSSTGVVLAEEIIDNHISKLNQI